MVIVTNYKITGNSETEILIKISEIPQCPYCRRTLKYRDSRSRYIKYPGGKRKVITVSRYKCNSCNRLHTCLPDIVVPYKHYSSEVIEKVLDGTTTSDDLETENYPTEDTMQLWLKWFLMNMVNINGHLKSLLLRISGAISTESIIEKMKSQNNWLRKIIVPVYNSGGAFMPLWG